MARAYVGYAQHVSVTPQTQPIPGRESEMVRNNAGGYGFVLDDWERLMRFLVIGSDNGTYYVGEQKLTAENAAVVIRCVKTDGPRVVEMAREVNVNNRAPKVDPQLFVLALAMKYGDLATKSVVRRAASEVLRTGTHLLHFVAMLDSLGGWNRSKRRLISDWFAQAPERVAFQCLKYANRDGWTMRDVLRVSHAKPATGNQDAVLSWVTGKVTLEKVQCLPSILIHHTAMNVMEGSPVQKALWGIERGIPREALPTEALPDLSVQKAMLPGMPIHALLRNLGNLTNSGLLNGYAEAALVSEKLVNQETLRKARVHPFAILLATLVYVTGRGVRGAKSWVPNNTIISALGNAYDLAFDYVEPTNKRLLIGVDISGSMSMPCMGSAVSASAAATAMAVTLARMEPHATVVQFDTAVRKIVPVTKRTSLTNLVNVHGGGTDLSAPVWWACGDSPLVGRDQLHAGVTGKAEYDAFVILTDNETWSGKAHLTQALARYRQMVNQRAKLVCCAFSASHANVVDPMDPLQFGTSGLDANLASLVSDFVGH